MNCTNCGEVLAPGTSSCPKCGTVFQPAQPVVAPAPVVPQAPVMPQTPVVSPVPAVESVPTQTPMFSEPAPTAQPDLQAAPVSAPIQFDLQAVPAVQPVSLSQQMPAGMPQPSPVPVQQQPAPQPSVGGIVSSQNTNNGGSKKGLVIGVIVVLLLAVLGLGGYLIYDKVQENKVRDEIKEELEEIDKEKEEAEETKKELKDKVIVREIFEFDNGALLLTVDNASSKTVSVDIEIEFYDVDEKILGTETEYVNLAPHTERYVFVSEYSVKEGYDSVKTNVSAMDYTGFIDVKNVSTDDLLKNETEDELIFQYKNESEYEMDVNTVVLFFSGKVLAYAMDDSEHFIAAGSNANLNVLLYDLENINYDRYEVYTYAEYDVYDD